MSERYETTEDVADHFQRSVYTIRKWARNGAIPGRKIGRDWFFHISDIEAHLAPTEQVFAQSNQSRGRRRSS